MRSLILGFILFTTTASAADLVSSTVPRTVDMTTVIKDGNVPLKDMFNAVNNTDCSKCEDLTVGMAAWHAAARKTKEDTRLPEVIWSESNYADSIKGQTAAELNSHQADVLISNMVRLYSGLGEFGMIVLQQGVPLLDPKKRPAPVQ